MEDSYGDGWNGAVLTINGVDYTVENSSEQGSSASACVDLLDCNSISWTPGYYDNETSWTLGNLASGSNGSGAGLYGCITGCSDASANNFNADANSDDGSCTYDIPGCIDSFACNYNSLSDVDDGSCYYDLGCGCDQPAAAEGSDCEGNCLPDFTPTSIDIQYVNNSTGEVLSNEYAGFWSLINNDTDTPVDSTFLNNAFTESFSGCLPDGCYKIIGSAPYYTYSFEYSLNGGEFKRPASGTYSVTGLGYFSIGENDCAGVCLNPDANNYDSLAIINDGSCQDFVFGCVDSTALNFNFEANSDDGSCIYEIVCDNPDQIGFQLTLTEAYGDDPSWDNDTLVIINSSGELVISEIMTTGNYFEQNYCVAPGCYLLSFIENNNGSPNYTYFATYNEINGEIFQSSMVGNNYPLHIKTQEDCYSSLYGCTDETALNFEPLAIVNDNCCYIQGCGDIEAINYDFDFDISENEACHNSNYCIYEMLTQNIDFPPGWSNFSSNLLSFDRSFDIMMSIDEFYENILIAKDYLGQAYLPDWNFNAIGEFSNLQGYQIKMSQADTLRIIGGEIAPENNPIHLPEGWYNMGYLREGPTAMDLLLADLVADESISIVKDYLGQAYLPDWNFNAIGDAKPGFGYQIKTTQECTLEYLPNNMSYRLASSLKVIENRSSYFPRATVTDNNMTLIIEDRAWDILPNQNTEIQALDSENNIVGSALYTSPTTVITLWGDDKYTSKKDGLDINEQVQLKLWDREQIRDFVIKDWVKGSSAYQINAINIASSIVTGNINIEADGVGTKSLVRIINLLGQEVQEENIDRTGQFLFKVYDDGSVERFIK